MAETFNYPIMTKPRGSTQYRVRKAQFGEGYAQRAGDGLNTKKQTWNITLDADMDEIQDALDFLDRHEGHVPFLWTPPGKPAPIWVVCGGYDETPHVASQNIVTATFEQDFEP